MFDMNAVKRAFGKAASNYDSHAQLQHEVREDSIRLGESCWAKGAAILDAGSGPGGFSHSVKLLGLGWNVTQLDVSLGMCKEAQALSPVVNASAEILPFADAAFDGVFSSLMLQWVNNPLAALREMARVTKPGGRCVISTFTEGTLRELSESFAVVDSAPHVSPFLAAEKLTTLAAHAGFTLLSAEEEVFTSYTPDALTLMRSLKSIGAGNKLSARRKGMMTPRQMEMLEQHYLTNFSGKKGLPVSWQVMFLVLGKIS